MNHPVVCVNWEQANTYCKWREDRLPTEAEWEKAARGTHGQIYPWGDADPNEALLNFCDRNCKEDQADQNYDDGYADTAPVGAYPEGVSPYGLLDMAGNVWEWTADWYDANYYAKAPSHNPQGPDEGERRVVRGGSWSANRIFAPVSYRNAYSPNSSVHDLGFRCVANVTE